MAITGLAAARSPALHLALVLLLCSNASWSGMSVDRMVIYFHPGQPPRQDVVITNPDDDTLYLQTEITKVEQPGSPDEKRVPMTSAQQMTLIATPPKAVIPPGGRKTIRLINTARDNPQELVYRVAFRPVVGEQQARRSAIKMLIAYEALVFIRPSRVLKQVQASCSPQYLTLTNNGNINVLLRNGQHCSGSGNCHCQPLGKVIRLYAGQSWQLPLTEPLRNTGGTIRFGLFDGQEETTQSFALPTPDKITASSAQGAAPIQ